MSEDMFDIIFTGDLVDGASLDLVKQKAVQVFRLNDSKVTVLFSGKRTVLKKNVDQSAAMKYQKILTGIGMASVVIAHREKPYKEPVPTPFASPAVKNVAESSAISMPPPPASELAVLPVGSLAADELGAGMPAINSVNASPELIVDAQVPDWEIAKPGTVLAEPVDNPVNNTYDGLSEVSLAPLAADLLTDKEKSALPTPPPLTSIENITVAQPGEDLLNTSEKSEFMELSIDTSHLSAPPSEGELLAEHEKRVFVETPLDTSQLSLRDVDV